MATRVFEISDMEWWAGDFDTPQQMFDYLVKEGVCTKEDDELPEIISDEAMTVMKISNPKNFDDDGNRLQDEYPSITFREMLDMLIEDKTEFPCFFAGTD